MTDQNNSDNEFTRPARRVSPSESDKTQPFRPTGDPENTFSSPQPPPSPPRRPVAPPTRAEQVTPRPNYPPPARPTIAQTQRAVPPPPQSPVNWGRWLFRGLGALGVLLFLLGGLAFAGGVLGYFWIASRLPSADELRSRSFQFATTQILDRDGNLLWEIIDPTGGRRTTVTLSQISPDLLHATIATEDRFFYTNVGVDPIAIARALYYNMSEGEIVSGASTITQQLARNVLLSQNERAEQTMSRKLKEAVLAVEISRRYTKDQILEIYLNQIYYGNLAYGIEAASQTYFGKPAKDLTLPEAALLAGLPQSPATHDPYVNPDDAKRRQEDVLRLMVEAGYITSAQAQAANATDLQLRQLGAAFAAPHFVTYVRQQLEQIVPPEYIYQAGLRVQTTLNPRLQAIAEEEVAKQVTALANRNVTNGALVALNTGNGQILAMVGSKDFKDEAIDGQVNMATSPRQPGSTMKPLTYLTAFEKLGYTPGTLLMDVPVQYPDGAGSLYIPTNYDNKFHGPVSLRTALANSYNIPPVKTLQAVGLDALKEMAARLGITTLTRPDYGLSLTLGSGEVPLVEMTGAFQAIANNGTLVAPTAILNITDSYGRTIEPFQAQPRQALNPAHAYLITNILADNQARTPAFGANSVLKLSRPAAAKTGTTNDYRDNWAIGYTPDIVTGVWVGNTDRSPMVNVSGLAGAAPIWHNFMERALEGQPAQDFTRPDTIVEMEVCADSGTLPSEACPARRKEIFFRDQPPLGPEHDIHQLIEIDLNSGLRANEFCRGNVEKRYYQVYPPDGQQWAMEHGIAQPPDTYCPSTNIVAKITNPADGSTVRGVTQLEGSATAANFARYQVELGVGTGPQAFTVIAGPVSQIIEQGVLGTFDTTQLANGPYTIRLVVFDQSGGSTEGRTRILVDNPATAVPTSTPTDKPATAQPTSTPEPPTSTPPPTDAPTSTPTITPPAETPTSTPTVAPPTEVPTDTPTVASPTEAPTQTPSTTEPPGQPGQPPSANAGQSPPGAKNK